MNIKKIEFEVKNSPELDRDFAPIAKFYEAFSKSAENGIDVKIALMRENDYVSVFALKLHGTADMREADLLMGERIVKTMLWSRGGYRVYIGGCDFLAEHIKTLYSPTGERSFDYREMSGIYEAPFEVISVPLCDIPEESGASRSVGRHLNGCRIGFDAGGSDRKVSAVIDGEPIWSEEVVWHPKTSSNSDYQFDGIVSAFRSAAEKMPRVDAIGVSSAGIFVNNRTMLCSLFLKVSKDDFNKKVKDIYLRAAKEIGDVPIEVANDGDVTALAGAMSLESGNVLGIAMGTSEAGGYVDSNGNITGLLNELAFMPVDVNPNAMVDEWSGDIGCGVKYFSQDGVIKLAGAFDLTAYATPAEKLKYIQSQNADAIFRSIGVYLGHSVAWYSRLYDIKSLMLLGRVMSGRGGDLIMEYAEKTLSDEYPLVAKKVKLMLPDEKTRRVGQSVAAASLPQL